MEKPDSSSSLQVTTSFENTSDLENSEELFVEALEEQTPSDYIDTEDLGTNDVSEVEQKTETPEVKDSKEEETEVHTENQESSIQLAAEPNFLNSEDELNDEVISLSRQLSLQDASLLQTSQLSETTGQDAITSVTDETDILVERKRKNSDLGSILDSNKQKIVRFSELGKSPGRASRSFMVDSPRPPLPRPRAFRSLDDISIVKPPSYAVPESAKPTSTSTRSSTDSSSPIPPHQPPTRQVVNFKALMNPPVLKRDSYKKK